MDSELVKSVEAKVASESFDTVVKNMPPEIQTSLRSYPSAKIQSRIDFDNLCRMDLCKLSVNQLKLLSRMKQELIAEIQSSEPEPDKTLPEL